jgi:protein-S-isoprenylcysteine O-methyltransferase Ste14
MDPDAIEQQVRRAGLMAVLVALVTIFWGLGRGLGRPVGHASGAYRGWLRRPLFYILTSAGYLGLCWRLWRPLPPLLSRRLPPLAHLLGSLLYFPGLALVLWGRLALGRMYDVSSSFGAQLYAGHRLVTTGPFAYVRHPMYLGILLTALGGMLLYRTWTFLFLLTHFPVLVVRAHHEEQALAEVFGSEWDAYCQQVPRWLPRCKGEAQ